LKAILYFKDGRTKEIDWQGQPFIFYGSPYRLVFAPTQEKQPDGALIFRQIARYNSTSHKFDMTKREVVRK